MAIVAGPRADEWRNGLRNDVLSPQQVAEVWSAVDELIAIRAKHDLIKHPELPSVQQVALRCILATCSAFVAFVSLALLLGWSGSLLWTGIGATGASVFAGILVRAGPVPHLGWGWFFGTAAFLTVGGATYLALIV